MLRTLHAFSCRVKANAAILFDAYPWVVHSSLTIFNVKRSPLALALPPNADA